MPSPVRIAVIGAGPIGLEAALFAQQAGYETTVYERGGIAENIVSWGHVRLFSPFGINASPWGCDLLKGKGVSLPGDEEILTGREFAERYLIPLAELPQLKNCIRSKTTVRAISRLGQVKTDHIGKPARDSVPFQLLLSTPQGEETAQAEYVLDCSGTYPNHNWAGVGGMPCPGEQTFLSEQSYRLPDILGNDRARFANRLVLVMGSGYSAATAIVALAELAQSARNTKAVWLTRRTTETPILPIPQDALPEREKLTTAANRLALDAQSPIAWRPGFSLRSVQKRPDGKLQVDLSSDDGSQESLEVDEVVAQVGYRPNRALYEELQIHECYATQGPMKLAAALLGETSSDCLAQSSHGGETLKNPEPGFFILGAKSYGRNSRFLLKVGLDQIREVFSLISQEPSSTKS